jgi:hypothetical protein
MSKKYSLKIRQKIISEYEYHRLPGLIRQPRGDGMHGDYRVLWEGLGGTNKKRHVATARDGCLETCTCPDYDYWDYLVFICLW